MNEEVMEDTELESSLLGLLSDQKFSLLLLHGELIETWLEDANNGPLLLHVSESLLNDDFDLEIQEAFGNLDITLYSFLVELAENSYYTILLFHGDYFKVALFGQEMESHEFMQALNDYNELTDDE